MIVATVLCSVLMLAVLTAVSALTRDQQRLARADAPRFDETIRLMRWDLANARTARFDGSLVIEGNAALDAQFEPTHRLAQVSYAITNGMLVRTQQVLDDPLRPVTKMVLAVDVESFNVAGAGEDAVILIRKRRSDEATKRRRGRGKRRRGRPSGMPTLAWAWHPARSAVLRFARRGKPAVARRDGHAPTRRGYALVLVMAVLVIAAAGMVGLSRASMSAAVRANARQREMQREWGARSLRRAILPRAESLLVARERQVQRPVARIDMQVRLGGQRFELMLRDEQAKANVNALLETSAAREAENRLVQQMTGTGLMGAVRLRPNPTPPPRRVLGPPPAGLSAGVGEAVSQRVTAYGQVLEGVGPERLSPGPADLLTCWGTGHLNIMRAPEPAMRLVLSSKLTGAEISRLITLRDELRRGERKGLITTGADAQRPVLRLLASAKIENRLGMPPMLESSLCHSLWVCADDGRRRWHQMEILDKSDPSAPRRWLVVW